MSAPKLKLVIEFNANAVTKALAHAAKEYDMALVPNIDQAKLEKYIAADVKRYLNNMSLEEFFAEAINNDMYGKFMVAPELWRGGEG